MSNIWAHYAFFVLLLTMNRSLTIAVIGFLCLCMTVAGHSQVAGIASYYHDSLKGEKMANGQRYNPEKLTCAHLTYPLGTILKVARKDNPEQSVMVTVVDRGPYIKGRVIDLSKAAAKEIGLLTPGIAEVLIALVKRPDDSGYAIQ